MGHSLSFPGGTSPNPPPPLGSIARVLKDCWRWRGDGAKLLTMSCILRYLLDTWIFSVSTLQQVSIPFPDPVHDILKLVMSWCHPLNPMPDPLGVVIVLACQLERANVCISSTAVLVSKNGDSYRSTLIIINIIIIIH